MIHQNAGFKMIDAISALIVQFRAFHVLSTPLYANIASFVYSLPSCGSSRVWYFLFITYRGLGNSTEINFNLYSQSIQSIITINNWHYAFACKWFLLDKFNLLDFAHTLYFSDVNLLSELSCVCNNNATYNWPINNRYSIHQKPNTV